MPVPLPQDATIVVVGGGPAGSFFAVHLLRRAHALGRQVRVIILEKKTEVCFYRPEPFCSWEGCNYCAGGISPRLADKLREERIDIPEDIIESRAVELILHGDWKSIQLPVPEGRQMLSVFRGSRPRQRVGRYQNFDSFLLQVAAKQGAEVITADATGVTYSAEGRPVVGYRTILEDGSDLPDTTIEADFVVLAGGVNRTPGGDVQNDPLLLAAQKAIPGMRPPKVRRTIIAEMTDRNDQLRALEGEIHFMQYGSKDLHIEMASMMPKNGWITTVLVGKSVDRVESTSCVHLVQRFVELPHIRRLLPHRAALETRCCCHPNMTIGAAKKPFGDRLALTGDLAVSRLYKDGLFSAYTTSTTLADCILDQGIDRASLARRYGPVVRAFHADNRYGRVIFLLSHSVLSRPALSRVLYRAVITERMTKPERSRRLALVLWQVTSGDDSYRRILVRMLHPAALWSILSGGLLLTFRDQVTERAFGLDWSGIPRYSTGVPLERVEATRAYLFGIQGSEPPSRAPQMERMFTIRIRAGKEAIMRQLGAFGDPDRQYLKPRFVRIRRMSGVPNQVGTVIRYHIPLLRQAFSVQLEKISPGRYLLYRIIDGMGTGGILAFVIDELRPGVNLLTIYVGFDFPRGHGLGRLGWALFRLIFPQFAHDVVWNHSLCQIRRLAEQEES